MPEDLEFYDRVSPIFNGKKYLVPAPTHCPECRLQRRLAVRNERSIYARKCDLCKKDIISQYPADSKLTVYCQSCWWGDKWDPGKYARKFDFNKKFFPQFESLFRDVPIAGSCNVAPSLDNSEYVNFVSDAKNCYLVFAANWLENCLYSEYIWETKDSVDCSNCTKLELCYFCIDSDNLYNCQYLQQCKGSINCILGYGLRNCQNCFGCINLVNKQYYFFNKELSKTEYEKKVSDIFSDEEKLHKAIAEFNDFSLKYPRKYTSQINCEDSTGNGLKDCSHCYNCFDGYNSEYVKWMMNFPGQCKDCYDVIGCAKIELCYEGMCVYPGYKDLFCNLIFNKNYNIVYSAYCDSGKDVFGCVGMKKGHYAIFNQEYSKEEYEKLAAKIVEHMQKTGEWGEFFPIANSLFAYNETVAHEYFPLSKEEVLARGWKWKEKEVKKVDNNLPICAKCGKNFKFIPQEIKFYKQHKIFLPHECPECRHQVRVKMRNSCFLWQRQCMCTQPDHNHHSRCTKEFETTYSPERKELVYCEECYRKEVY
jgi:DNA-directed RNA polymerase subunit RPC12/RpoP